MLLKATAAVAAPFKFSTSGLRIDPWLGDDGSARIDEIYPDSPAARAGLAVGDRIVAVGSQPTRELGVEEIRDQLQQPPGTEVMLQISRGEAPREVALVLATLL